MFREISKINTVDGGIFHKPLLTYWCQPSHCLRHQQVHLDSHFPVCFLPLFIPRLTLWISVTGISLSRFPSCRKVSAHPKEIQSCNPNCGKSPNLASFFLHPSQASWAKGKEEYLYSAFYILCISQSAQAWITQFYLQIHQACLSFVSVHQMR